MNRFDRKTGIFTRYLHVPENPNSLSHNRTRKIAEDGDGNIWISTNFGLNRLNPNTEKFTRYLHDPKNPGSISHNTVYTVYITPSGTLWAGTSMGIDQYDPKTDTFTHSSHDPNNPDSISPGEVSTIFEDSFKNIWIGMYTSGLNRFDPKAQTFINYRHDPNNPLSISANDIRSIYEDSSQNIWLGTKGGGVCKFNLNPPKFFHVTHSPDDSASLSQNEVIAIYRDRQEILWVGTNDGLNRQNPVTGEFRHFSHNPMKPTSISSSQVSVIFQDKKGQLFFGTEDGGLNLFDPKTEQFKTYINDPNDPHSISGNHIISIFEDSEETLWIGTYQNGLNRFDTESGIFTRYRHDPTDAQSLSHNEIGAIYEDRQNYFWIGTANGLNRMNRRTGKAERFQPDPLNPQSLKGRWIYVIHEDRQGYLWIGTKDGGLSRMDKKRESFVHYTTQNGLPDNVINGILEDDDNQLWLSTNNGICRLNLQKKSVKSYSIDDGLQDNEFQPRTFFKDGKGRMYFGGINGYNYFFPRQIKDNPHLPPVVLTDFKKFNKSVKLDQPTIYVDQIFLSHRDIFFSFEFSGLEYTEPAKNQYAYKMEGFDREWIHIKNRRHASYMNLDPGKYVFRAKAANNDGIWNEDGISIQIQIEPPPWKRWWAYTLYTFMFFLGIAGYMRHQTKSYRKALKEQARTRELLEKKVKEKTADLKKANAALELLSHTDGLTALYNRRYFDLQLEKEWKRLCRKQSPLSLIMCDIDYFKAFNDTYGHSAGDDCLKTVAQAMVASIKRTADKAFRYGGEEFALLLPETDSKGALAVAERIQEKIKQLGIPHSGSLVKPTVSISFGAATMIPEPVHSAVEILLFADKALYKSKNGGRDQISQNKEA